MMGKHMITKRTMLYKGWNGFPIVAADAVDVALAVAAAAAALLLVSVLSMIPGLRELVDRRPFISAWAELASVD
jgi:hypothetical protein